MRILVAGLLLLGTMSFGSLFALGTLSYSAAVIEQQRRDAEQATQHPTPVVPVDRSSAIASLRTESIVTDVVLWQ